MILSCTEDLQSQKFPIFFLYISVPFKKSLAFVFAFTVDWKLLMLLCIVGILGGEKNPVTRRNSVLDEGMHLSFTNKPASPDLLITRGVMFSDLK